MPLVGGLCHVQRTSHSSMGVTTSTIMPLVGGLCHVQRTSTLWANAPRRRTLSRTTDFALVNGSDHLYDHAPHRRTLSRTTDFDPLGQRPSSEDFVTYNGLRPSGPPPLVGGLCHVQRTSPAGHNMISSKLEHNLKKPMTHREYAEK